MIKVALDRQGSDQNWGVVRQVDHARLAFDLAERSTLLAVLPPSTSAEVLCAIDHHDDGWQERDLAIEIDPRRARPRTFDEMTVDEALAIWDRSIDRALGFGILSAWTVAGHFAYLATLKQGAERERGRRWADEREARRKVWLDDWLSLGGSNHSEHAARALASLKLFDSLSLFVIGVGSDAERIVKLPDGASATIVRHPGGVFSADPWFFDDDDLSFTVPGCLVAGTRIVDRWQPPILLRRGPA